MRKTKFDLILHIGPIPNITANVVIEKKIFNDDAHFEGAICQDFGLTLCTVVFKRLRKCGSCHIVSKNV